LCELDESPANEKTSAVRSPSDRCQTVAVMTVSLDASQLTV